MTTSTLGGQDRGLVALRAAIAEHRIGPYLLTVTDHARPHVGDVSYTWRDNELMVAAPSSWAGSERLGHVDCTLLWPPDEPGGYSPIIDGKARATPEGLAITPTRAVHYRPASTPSGEECGADCIAILLR